MKLSHEAEVDWWSEPKLTTHFYIWRNISTSEDFLRSDLIFPSEPLVAESWRSNGSAAEGYRAALGDLHILRMSRYLYWPHCKKKKHMHSYYFELTSKIHIMSKSNYNLFKKVPSFHNMHIKGTFSDEELSITTDAEQCFELI